jgi:hypothetical protein
MLTAGRSAVFDNPGYQSHRFSLSDFFNFNVFLLGVPIFLSVSCYLFDRKNPNKSYFWNRIRRIALLLAFWPVALLLWRGGLPGLIGSLPAQPLALLEFFARAGHTIYYFFVCLLLLTAITFGALCINKSAAACLAMLSFVAVAAMPIITIAANMPKLSAWWHPLPFLPYAFASVLLAKYEPVIDRWRVGLASLLLAASFMAGLLEWKCYMNPVYFSMQPYAMPAYMRPSLVLSAYGLLLLAIGFKAEIPRWVRYMADRSLGLYCLHPFFMLPVNEFAPRCFSMMSNVMARTVLVIGLSYAAIRVLHFFVKEDFLLVSRRQ